MTRERPVRSRTSTGHPDSKRTHFSPSTSIGDLGPVSSLGLLRRRMGGSRRTVKTFRTPFFVLYG